MSENNNNTEENNICEERYRTRVVALAVREACYVANYSHRQHDWEAACKVILHNQLLTSSEKSMIITLLQM